MGYQLNTCVALESFVIIIKNSIKGAQLRHNICDIDLKQLALSRPCYHKQYTLEVKRKNLQSYIFRDGRTHARTNQPHVSPFLRKKNYTNTANSDSMWN